MALTVVRLEIRGQVQGVGYRWSMVEQAGRIGVTGWVRNRRDGSVEAMVAGDADAIEQMIEWAKRGPRSAVVSAVGVHPGEGSFESFELHGTA
jgi:acylphosphatase